MCECVGALLCFFMCISTWAAWEGNRSMRSRQEWDCLFHFPSKAVLVALRFERCMYRRRRTRMKAFSSELWVLCGGM